jgi:L-alanine-DL-glutamate epimerase-like enolase superfamily enzyme
MSTPRLTLTLAQEPLPLAEPFTITGYTFTEVEVIVARLDDGSAQGQGEASGVYYLGDDVPAMRAAVESVRAEIEAGLDREALRRLLPPGGARNVIDSALWDLEAKRSGRPVWQAAGVAEPRPLLTTFTLGADDPAVMARKAVGHAQARALKLKLTGDAELDAARVKAVRQARPGVWMGVDGNQGFVPDSLAALMPTLVAAEVKLLEQPFARGREADLVGLSSPIPVAADESALCLADLEGLVGKVDVINIKLDKCGGLTEGLAMAAESRRLGMKVMVGNMVGSSLAMAPAYILGQLCDFVDLDGPIFLAHDRATAVTYEDGLVSYPDNGWGGAG